MSHVTFQSVVNYSQILELESRIRTNAVVYTASNVET